MFPDLLRDDVFRLETARLWLRWPRMSDAQAFVRLAGDKEIAQMTANIPHPYPVAEAEKFVFASRAGNAAGKQIALALTLKGRPKEAIGMAGIHQTRAGHAFIGYWLGRPFHGQGLMSEAARELVDLAFRVGDLDDMIASARTDNIASRRVLEKAGFVHAGTGPVDAPARGGILHCDRFRLDRALWTQARAPQPPAVENRLIA